MIKSHGHFSTTISSRRNNDNSPYRTDIEMNKTRGVGIVLIRNPFKVLYSMRNYDAKGFYGHADAADFSGAGMLCSKNELTPTQTYN